MLLWASLQNSAAPEHKYFQVLWGVVTLAQPVKRGPPQLCSLPVSSPNATALYLCQPNEWQRQSDISIPSFGPLFLPSSQLLFLSKSFIWRLSWKRWYLCEHSPYGCSMTWCHAGSVLMCFGLWPVSWPGPDHKCKILIISVLCVL